MTSVTTPLLRRLAPDAAQLGSASARAPFSKTVLEGAREIVRRVAKDGLDALLELRARYDDLAPDTPLLLERDALERTFNSRPAAERALLERTADRIRRFAEAQRAALLDVEIPVPGGRAGHRFLPLESAAGYVPAGRYPLPSSALMNAIPARTAGVARVLLATPKPDPTTLAAAFVAGADAVLLAGGAQAIAALAYGAGPIAPVDVITGPGNAWVTAAKSLVTERVAIDGLAGPSELLVIAGPDANPAWIAADLLAQAEHDELAEPGLLAFDEGTLEAVERELGRQLPLLDTRDTAARALSNGFAVLVDSDAQALELSERLAPEHLQLVGARAEALGPRLARYGALFVGERSGEVLGDYGAGPNHVLPTGGTARFASGLSVLDFLRARTFLELDDAAELAQDSADLARLEGLSAHAAAADLRL